MTSARITLVGRDALRPPLIELTADVTLRHDGERPRWWLVAASAGPEVPPVGTAGVHSVEVAAGDGALVGHFAGAAPFGALRLGAGDELTLRGWPITVRDDPPVTAVEVGVVNAAEVVIGGLPVAAWLQRGTWIDEHLGLHDVELVDARRESITVST